MTLEFSLAAILCLLGYLAVDALLIGFIPLVLTRLFARCYPIDDPFRREMVAEMYVVPYSERWRRCGENLDRAIFEGLATRRDRRLERLVQADSAALLAALERSRAKAFRKHLRLWSLRRAFWRRRHENDIVLHQTAVGKSMALLYAVQAKASIPKQRGPSEDD